MAPATRRQVAEIINEVPGIIKNQVQLATEFRFPPPTTPPSPELAPPQPQPDGRGCRKCPCVIRQNQRIQEHCGAVAKAGSILKVMEDRNRKTLGRSFRSHGESAFYAGDSSRLGRPVAGLRLAGSREDMDLHDSRTNRQSPTRHCVSCRWLVVPGAVHGYDSLEKGINDAEMNKDAKEKADKVIGMVGEWLLAEPLSGAPVS